MKRIDIVNLILACGLNHAQAATLTDAFDESELCRLVETSDSVGLQVVRGIGPRSAEKLISGLVGKLCYTEEQRRTPDLHLYDVRRITLNPTYGQSIDGIVDHRRFVADTVHKRFGPLQQKILALSHGDESALFNSVSTISGSDPDEIKVAKASIWENAVKQGLKSKCGKRYRIYGHGTNAAKENACLWVEESLYDEVMAFSNCGAHADWKVTPAKKIAYAVGLLSVFTKELPFDLQPEQVQFFPGLNREHEDLIVKVDKRGTVTNPAMRTHSQEEFDGLAVLHISEKMMAKLTAGMNCEEECAFRKKIAKMRDFTFRGPYNKGLMVTFFNIHRFLHDHGVHTINGKDIDDIIVFADESVMKASIGGAGAAYSSYEEYCENFHRFGHRYGRLIDEHADTPHNLPYQQIQAAAGASRKTIIEGAQEEVNYILSFRQPEKAASYLGGELAGVAKLVPSILKERWFNSRVQASHTKTRNAALGATAHGITHYAFICPDLVAFAQHVAGLNPVGCLKPHQAYLKNSVAGEAVITRSPCLDPGSLCIMDIVDTLGCYDTYFAESTTLMLSSASSEATRMRGDYDGDHVIYTMAKWVLKAVKESHAAYGNFLVDWVAPKAEKKAVTRADEEKYFVNLVHTNRLGQYCDMLTKCYALGIHDQKVISWLTYAANVLVDAGKHGGEAFTVPGSVKDLADTSLPLFAGIAKDNKHPSLGPVHQQKASESYGQGEPVKKSL